MLKGADDKIRIQTDRRTDTDTETERLTEIGNVNKLQLKTNLHFLYGRLLLLIPNRYSNARDLRNFYKRRFLVV